MNKTQKMMNFNSDRSTNGVGVKHVTINIKPMITKKSEIGGHSDKVGEN